MEPLEARVLLSGSVESQAALQSLEVSAALFVENQGQWADESVRFVHHGSGANVVMTDAGAVFQLFRSPPAADESPAAEFISGFTRTGPEMMEIAVWFAGARTVTPVGLAQSAARFNYLIGDQESWRCDVPAYEIVAYEGLYPGVDLLTWGRTDNLKYEFRIAPVDATNESGSPEPWRQIQITYTGIEGLWLDDAGVLHVSLAEGWGEMIDDAPYIYQEIDGRRVEVAGRFELIDDHSYRFEVTGDYDAAQPLVIDPELTWAAFLGGQYRDIARAVAVDHEGNIVVVGVTDSANFPVMGSIGSSPHLDQFGGIEDAFVTKIKADGSGILWSGFVGGTWGDEALGVAIDALGNIAVVGITMSTDFPQGAGFSSGWHGPTDLDKLQSEAFVMKFSPAGALLWSGLLGGSHADAANAVAFDLQGDVVVAGGTWSDDFSVAGALHSGYLDQTYHGAAVPTPPNTNDEGCGDAFVAKISANGASLLWSGYLGGSMRDSAKAVAVDPWGNVLVAGYTRSSNFPGRASFDTSFNGGGVFNSYAEGGDAFVVKIRPNGTEVLWSAFLGGSDIDCAYGLAVDAGGDVIVGGYTASSNFPTLGSADPTLGGPFDGFVARIRADGTALVWSRYLGGGDFERLRSVAIDSVGNVYAVGTTSSDDFPLLNQFQNRPQREFAQYFDGFITKLDTAGQTVWSSYLGGTADDTCYGVAVFGGTVIVVGETWESTFPVRNSFDTSFGGPGRDEWGAYHSGDGFVARITDRADWTLMVYSTSDSDLESWGLTYLAQMESVDFRGLSDGRQVKILMLLDRSAIDQGTDYSGDAVPSSGDSWSDTRVSQLVYNDSYGVGNWYASTFYLADPQQPELNMGDPQTLANFVQWAMNYAPAYQYGLIFWGHGYGWQGTQFDDNNAASPAAIDSLSMPELRAALSAVPKLDLVVMDSCLMQQVEVATEFWGETDYLVASEQERSAGRINYPKWLATLKQVPNISAMSLAQVIVAEDTNTYVSALDMSKLGGLNAAIESFALAATTLANATDLQHLQAAIASADFFHTTSYRDLKQYMQAVAADSAINATVRAQASGVISAIGEVVMAGHKGGGGVAIYLPDNADSLAGNYGAAWLRFCDIDAGPPGTRWADFLRKMLGAPPAVNPVADVGNTANAATVLTVSAGGIPVMVESDIAAGDPADFYRFTGLAGDVIYVEVSGAGAGGLAPVLTLYAPDKTTVLARVTADANGRAVLDRISLSQNGDYYLAVTPPPAPIPPMATEFAVMASATGASGAYTMAVRRGTAAQMQPQLDAPASVAFGDVPLGSNRTAVLNLANYGGAPLIIRGLTLASGAVFDPSLAPLALPLTLAPGEAIAITAMVMPTAAGFVADTLHILSNDPVQPDRSVLLSATAVDPWTAYDQYLLELINRGRADPAAEAARYGISLNEGLAAGTISTTPKQPLAFNVELGSAAQVHSLWMLDNDTFSHTGQGGSTPTSRMTTAGYDFIAPWGSAENIALIYSSGAINLTNATATLHRNLFVDENYDGRGHRINLMNGNFKEIGVGVLTGLWGAFNAAIVTEDFAYQAGNSFLTGVAYIDTVLDDDFYTPGEGLGGVTVQATRISDNAVFSTTTWTAGGYSLALPAGTYNVVASGGGLGAPIIYNSVVIGAQNVKRDFILQQAPAAPEITVLDGATNIPDGQTTPISFGSVVQGSTGPTKTFTVRNDGGQTLTLGSVTLPAGYTLTEGLSTSLAPGASDTFTVRLNTTTVGTFSGQISFSNNDSNENPFNFAITGTVTAAPAAPEITVLDGATNIPDGQTTPISFGSVVQGSTGPTKTFTVRNDGGQTLTLGSVTLPAGYTLTEGLSTSLAPGASDTFTVRLNTTTVGTFSGQISFSNNDSDENPFNFAITGTVTAAPVGPEITVLLGQTNIVDGQTTPIDFGTALQGSVGPTRTFTVRNDGDQNLSFISLTYPSGYSVVQNLTSPLAPGASMNLVIQLNTTIAGVFSGQITLANNDADENPFNFPITGVVTSSAGGDIYEYDDDPFYASIIATNGTPQTHSINPVGDRDWVAFTLAEPSNVIIATNGVTGDTRIWLYGPNNPYLLIEGDDDDGPGLFSLIERTGANALPAGTYWVEIQDYDDTRLIDNYTIAVTATPAQALYTTTLSGGQTYIFTDANGSTITLKFTGKAGSAVINRAVPDGQAGDIVSIELRGTDAKSGLTITGKGGTDNGVTTVGLISGASPMGKLTAKTLDLVGQGIIMSAQGCFTSITIRDLLGGADLILPGDSVIKGAVISLGRILAGTRIESGSPIKTFSTTHWSDAGEITAPWIGTLSTKVDTVRLLGGHFGADVNLSGVGVPKTTTLSAAKIVGNITGGAWTIVGNTGAITAAEIRPAFSILASGTIKSILSRSHASGNYEAMALASFTVKGDLYNAVLRLHQPVVAGNAKLLGLGKLNVTGWVDGVSLRTDGSMGALVMGALCDSEILAGVAPGVTGLPMSPAGFTAAATIVSLKMKGLRDLWDPHSFINSNVAAWNIGSFSLVGAKRSNGQIHGLAGHTIKSLRLVQPDKTAYTWPGKWLAAPGDFVVQMV